MITPAELFKGDKFTKVEDVCPSLWNKIKDKKCVLFGKLGTEQEFKYAFARYRKKIYIIVFWDDDHVLSISVRSNDYLIESYREPEPVNYIDEEFKKEMFINGI